jgi:NADP-dependent 3-hydroxy acid dehydrogenase YdfG
MIDTNIKGLLYMTRLISPRMMDRRSGHIINIGSTAGKEVYPSGNVYCATKFAVEALTKAFRLDLYAFGIRVSQISPGHVEETEFALVRFDGDKDRAKIYDEFMPLQARDVAEMVYFVASRPPHVNIQDILAMGTQQASSVFINKSGREDR